jgi:hypothetical protein
MGKTLFVVDIDNTIADASRRLRRAGKEPSRKDKKKYDAWVKAVQSAKTLMADKPVPGIRELLCSLPILDVLYVTSREERWRKMTVSWIKKHDFPYGGCIDLVMRPNGDYSETHVLKQREIRSFSVGCMYDEVVVLDDDPSGELTKVCKREGWTMLRVGG